MNMKKKYVAPSVEEVKIESVAMIAASSLKIYSSSVDTSKEDVQLGNDRRGDWGNLWK